MKPDLTKHIRYDTAEQIQFCMSCSLPECNNCMQYVPKGELPKIRGLKIAPVRGVNPPKKTGNQNPCLHCSSKKLCESRGWTCKDKATWEVAHG